MGLTLREYLLRVSHREHLVNLHWLDAKHHREEKLDLYFQLLLAEVHNIPTRLFGGDPREPDSYKLKALGIIPSSSSQRGLQADGEEAPAGERGMGAAGSIQSSTAPAGVSREQRKYPPGYCKWGRTGGPYPIPDFVPVDPNETEEEKNAREERSRISASIWKGAMMASKIPGGMKSKP